MIYLKDLLEQEIEKYKSKILMDINRFIASENKYWNISYSSYLQAIFRKGSNEQLKTIGFPFPLISFPLNIGDIKDISLNICLRGKPLRDFQRNQLIKELKQKAEVFFNEIEDITIFRKLTKQLCTKYESCNYFDPYYFIGDSLIGLHFIENFTEQYHLKLKNIYSENYLNLDFVSNTKGYVEAPNHNKKDLAVFSDLIDTHYDRTKHLVKNLALRNIPSIVIGRNLLVIPENGHINIYHYIKEDHLLKEENIEDYMNKCLEPYLLPNKNKFRKKKIISRNIVINPFASELEKNITEEIVFQIIKDFKGKYPDSKILIIAGFRNSLTHLAWCAKLKGRLFEKGLFDEILFKNYGSLTEIKKDLEKYDISLGITADTSIAHLFNYMGIINITVYNLERCDLSSPQSLASDSPLGFCRFGQTQFPALLHKDREKLIRGIIGFLEYFLNNTKNKNWTKDIFDDRILISRIDKDKNPLLVRSNNLINPTNKIFQNDKIR